MIPTTFEKFQETLKEPIPSNQWPAALKSLWWDAKGDWNASHDIAQEIHTPMGSWIHAYLHRKEGDEWNAGYPEQELSDFTLLFGIHNSLPTPSTGGERLRSLPATTG